MGQGHPLFCLPIITLVYSVKAIRTFKPQLAQYSKMQLQYFQPFCENKSGVFVILVWHRGRCHRCPHPPPQTPSTPAIGCSNLFIKILQ